MNAIDDVAAGLLQRQESAPGQSLFTLRPTLVSVCQLATLHGPPRLYPQAQSETLQGPPPIPSPGLKPVTQTDRWQSRRVIVSTLATATRFTAVINIIKVQQLEAINPCLRAQTQ